MAFYHSNLSNFVRRKSSCSWNLFWTFILSFPVRHCVARTFFLSGCWIALATLLKLNFSSKIFSIWSIFLSIFARILTIAKSPAPPTSICRSDNLSHNARAGSILFWSKFLTQSSSANDRSCFSISSVILSSRLLFAKKVQILTCAHAREAKKLFNYVLLVGKYTFFVAKLIFSHSNAN